jgi:choline dehydrogenase-like flavoprotein
MAIHEMGTARMGNDPKDSVLNKWNQMQVSNVFVTDGSCMPSIACQNLL